MAELLLSAIFPVLFKKLASSELLNYFASKGGVNSELKMWEKKLKKIEAVLCSAEEKQLMNQAVKMWLDDLRDLAYDVEDLLEEFAFEAARHSSNPIFKNFTPVTIMFDLSLRSRIKDINRRFEDLSNERAQLGLMQESFGGISSTALPAQQGLDPRPPSSSLPTEPAIYGRDEDIKEILKMLSSDKPGDSNFAVIAIVGMGGLGKTTLAREVYNDKTLEHLKLEKKVWVSVSHNFDVLSISKSILESIRPTSSNLNSLNEVLDKLKEEIHGRKFLLVLDDVWNENYNLWETLKSPFKDGATGSKMIVTTRNKRVASIMGSSEPYDLKPISDEDCWSLFLKHAPLSSMDNIDALRITSLFHERVVKNCGGLPLVAKTLGGLLRHEPRVGAWESILNNKIWDSPDPSSVLPVLRLSYHHLPSHLKRCFAYCAIFPKDYEFEEKELGLLWIAEGIIQRSNKQMDLAGEYFRHLYSRSFLQQSSSNNSKYIMHDHVHDLAQLVFGEICYRFEEANTQQPKNFERIRHFSYISNYLNGKDKFKDLHKFKSLRTFLPIFISPYVKDNRSYISAMVLFDLLPKLKQLRVLSLERYCITHLPDSIGCLIHLTYLNFSNTKIKSLPESISSLLNLQFLILKDCSRLMKLPSKMRCLSNLCHLNIKGANSLEGMPTRMKELKNLQILSNFIVGHGKSSNLEDLKSLNFLRGELHISKLENAIAPRSVGGILSNKNDLKVLLLEWGSQFDQVARDEVDKRVLDMLEPHNNLRGLTIRFYGGSEFPSWLKGSVLLSNMVVFKLENCNNCTSLPSLEMFSSLKDLTIKEMPRLDRIDFEMPLKSLEILCFENLQEWQYWNTKRENDAAERFPCLRELSIIDCPKLTGEVPNCLPSLERLFIKKCTELTVSFSSFSLLSKLEIDDCKGVMCNSTISADFPSVNSVTSSSNSRFGNWMKQGFQKVLKIVGWKELMNLWQDLTCVEKPLRGIHGLTFLKELYIVRCTSIVFFTDQINLLPNLSSLTISNWEALESFLEVLKQNNLESLVIRDCDSLSLIARDTLPPSLTKLEIRKCENLKELEDFSTTLLESLSIYDCQSLMCVSSLGQFPETLEHISIERCPELLTILFSGAQYLPKALEDLSIKYCSRLNSIGETFNNSTSLKEIMLFACEQLDSIPSGLHNLTCLKSFRIGNCPNIRISLKFPSSLQTLDVLNCPILLTEEGFPTNLTDVNISEDVDMCKPLTEWRLHNFTSLRRLCISGTPSFPLTSLSSMPFQSVTSLKVLTFRNFPELKTTPDLGSLISLQHLWIDDCPNLKSIPHLKSLTSLKSLQIWKCPKLVSVPNLGSFTSLESLKIRKCPKLISFQSMPSSLLLLEIEDCPWLKFLWKRGTVTAKYCSTIAHIPKVEIDEKFIYNSKEEE